MHDIRTYARLSLIDQEELVKDISYQMNLKSSLHYQVAKKDLQTIDKKIAEINIAVKNLYKEKLSGKMLEAFFYSLLEEFETVLKPLKDRQHKLAEDVICEKKQDIVINYKFIGCLNDIGNEKTA